MRWYGDQFFRKMLVEVPTEFKAFKYQVPTNNSLCETCSRPIRSIRVVNGRVRLTILKELVADLPDGEFSHHLTKESFTLNEDVWIH